MGLVDLDPELISLVKHVGDQASSLLYLPFFTLTTPYMYCNLQEGRGLFRVSKESIAPFP